MMELPGGLWEGGRCRRSFGFRPVSGALELAVAERTAYASSPSAAVTEILTLALVHLGGDAPSPDRVDALCVADRQYLMRLLQLHLGLGSFWVKSRCRGCGEDFDFFLDLSGIPVIPAGKSYPFVTVECGGETLTFRLPNGGDQARILGIGDEKEAMTRLMEVCLLEGTLYKEGLFETSMRESPLTEGHARESSLSQGPVGEGRQPEGSVGEGPQSEGPVGEGRQSESSVGESPLSEGPVTENRLSKGSVSETCRSEGAWQKYGMADAHSREGESVNGTGNGAGEITGRSIDDTLARAVEKRMEEVSPKVLTEVHAPCPGCGSGNMVDVDPYEILNLDPDRILDEVHRIAWHYHWSEAEILALPRDRRRRYLEKIDRMRGMSR